MPTKNQKGIQMGIQKGIQKGIQNALAISFFFFGNGITYLADDSSLIQSLEF